MSTPECSFHIKTENRNSGTLRIVNIINFKRDYHRHAEVGSLLTLVHSSLVNRAMSLAPPLISIVSVFLPVDKLIVSEGLHQRCPNLKTQFSRGHGKLLIVKLRRHPTTDNFQHLFRSDQWTTINGLARLSGVMIRLYAIMIRLYPIMISISFADL